MFNFQHKDLPTLKENGLQNIGRNTLNQLPKKINFKKKDHNTLTINPEY